MGGSAKLSYECSDVRVCGCSCPVNDLAHRRDSAVMLFRELSKRPRFDQSLDCRWKRNSGGEQFLDLLHPLSDIGIDVVQPFSPRLIPSIWVVNTQNMGASTEYTGDSRQAVGARIKALREERGLTQGQLAERIGAAEVTVGTWERGISMPGEDNFPKLAKVLKTTEPALRYGAVSEARQATIAPETHTNPIGRYELRPRPYTRVYEYLEKMRAAGMPETAVDEARRYLVESNFGQMNKRDYRVRDDDEVITDIDAMWAALKIRFKRDWGIEL